MEDKNKKVMGFASECWKCVTQEMQESYILSVVTHANIERFVFIRKTLADGIWEVDLQSETNDVGKQRMMDSWKYLRRVTKKEDPIVWKILNSLPTYEFEKNDLSPNFYNANPKDVAQDPE